MPYPQQFPGSIALYNALGNCLFVADAAAALKDRLRILCGLSVNCQPIATQLRNKAHTKSAALYTCVAETETKPPPATPSRTPGKPMSTKNPILGLCQQAASLISAAKVDQCPPDEG